MIDLSFLEFFRGDFTDQGYDLYILKDSYGQTMYIGISRISVWERWFGGLSSHMEALPDGRRLRGKSYIGEVIERRFPEAWSWRIELRSREDCIRSLVEEGITKVGGRDVQSLRITDIEAFLIQRASPTYNATHGGRQQQDPLLKKELDEAYNKIFNSKHR